MNFSPIFTAPYKVKGIASNVIKQLFNIYPNTIEWWLSTIKQEERNCHLYEKCGFVRTGDEIVVNENMTLVFYVKSYIEVRRFKEEDAKEVRNLIVRNFLEVNSKDYGISAMEKLAKVYNVEIDISGVVEILNNIGDRIKGVEVYFNPHTTKLVSGIKGEKLYDIITQKEV